MSMTRFGQSVVLACMAFAVALSGCTSKDDSGGLGGAEVALTLETPPGGEDEIINTIQADWQCEGNDPFTGIPRPPEQEMINVTTTEGNNPLDPKSRTGILSVRGQPVGDCTFDFVAVSEGTTDVNTCDLSTNTCTNDGSACADDTECADMPMPNVECRAEDVVVDIQRDVNKDILVTMVCIRLNQLGGANFDAQFDECPQIKQVVVSPTTQTNGNDIDVRTAVYDADGDDAEVFVQLSCAGTVNPVGGNVIPSCDDFAQGCTEDIRTVSATDAGACDIIVTVTDPGQVLCNGLNPDGSSNTSARQVVDTNWLAPADCGNGGIDPGETCDPPSIPDTGGNCVGDCVANLSGDWCDANCQDVGDPCVPETRFCPTAADEGYDAQCAFPTCTSTYPNATDGDIPTCGMDLPTINDNVSCTQANQSAGVCDGGQCVPPPACVPGPGACDDGNVCTDDSCVNNQCVNDGTGNIGNDCPDDGQGQAGICQGAAGDCTNPCDIGPVDCSGNEVCDVGGTDQCANGNACLSDADCPAECNRSECDRATGVNQGTCQNVLDTTLSCGPPPNNGLCTSGTCEIQLTCDPTGAGNVTPCLSQFVLSDDCFVVTGSVPVPTTPVIIPGGPFIAGQPTVVFPQTQAALPWPLLCTLAGPAMGGADVKDSVLEFVRGNADPTDPVFPTHSYVDPTDPFKTDVQTPHGPVPLLFQPACDSKTDIVVNLFGANAAGLCEGAFIENGGTCSNSTAMCSWTPECYPPAALDLLDLQNSLGLNQAFQFVPSGLVETFGFTHDNVAVDLGNVLPPTAPNVCIGGACPTYGVGVVGDTEIPSVGFPLTQPFDGCPPTDRDGDADGETPGGDDAPRIMYDANCLTADVLNPDPTDPCTPFVTGDDDLLLWACDLDNDPTDPLPTDNPSWGQTCDPNAGTPAIEAICGQGVGCTQQTVASLFTSPDPTFTPSGFPNLSDCCNAVGSGIAMGETPGCSAVADNDPPRSAACTAILTLYPTATPAQWVQVPVNQ